MRRATLAIAVVAGLVGPARANDASFTLAVGGDLLLGRGVAAAASRAGWDRTLAPLRASLAGADAALVNLESPLATCLAGGTVQYPRLCGDPQAAAALAHAGIAAVSLANNHALDAGDDGRADTARRLRAAGVVTVGAGDALTVERLGPIEVLAANLSRPAWPPGHDRPLPAPTDLAAAVRAFRARAPAAPLLVFLHGGRELDATPGSRDDAYARAAVAAGASAVVFQGAHVRRPLTTIDGVPVHFGLGNLLFDQHDPRAARGEVLLLRFRPGRPAEVIGARAVDTLTGTLL